MPSTKTPPILPTARGRPERRHRLRRLLGDPRLVILIVSILFGLVILILVNALIHEERIVILLLGLLTGGTLMLLALLTNQQKAQLALRQSESRFRALSAMGSDWYWETDAQHRFTQISEGLLRLSGRTESEYLGKTLWEIPFCAPTGSNWIQHQAVIAEQNPFADFCIRYLSPAGAVGYGDFSGEPVFGADGEFKGYRGVGADITIEMILRHQLRMQHDVMRALTQSNDAESAFRNVIEIVCRTMEWGWGARRHLDRETLMLSCHEHWLAPGLEADEFVAVTRQTKRANFETGTATLSMMRNEIVWHTDKKSKDFRRGALARAANLHGIAAIPIVRGTETTDSLEFFSARPEIPNQVLRETLAAVGQELAQFLDRIDERLAREILERERRILLDRLQLQLNHMPIACLIQDRNFCIDYSNPAAERIFGFTVGEMQGRDAVDFLVPEYMRAEVWARRARLQAGEHNVTATNENITRDGRTIICEWNLTFLTDEAGAFAGVLAVAQDVTERTRMISALEDSEERYRRIFASAPVPMWVADVPTPRFLAVNDAMVEKYGYSRTELLQMSALDLQLPEDLAKVSAEIRENSVAGLQSYYERRHVTRDGQVLSVELTAHPFQFGGKSARLNVANDVTEKHGARLALEQSEARFRAVFEQASVGIGIRDVSLRPRWQRVNRKLCEILGYSETELLQLTSVDITPEADLAETAEYNVKLRSSELRSYSRQKRYQRKDGHIIWVELSVAVVDGADGKPQYLISVIQDITESVESRQLLRDSEARYRQLFALTPLPMYLRREDTLQFIDVNDACLATYGYTREEMLALSGTDIQIPDQRENFARSAVEDIGTMVVRRHKKHLRRNGEIFGVEIFSCPITVGAVSARLVLVRDMTEQLHAEQLLRDSERRVAMALEGSGGAIFDWDLVTGDIYLSDQWNIMLGNEAEEIHTTASAMEVLVHPEDRECHHGIIIQLLKQTEGSHHSEYRYKTPSGGWIWIESRASVIERDANGRALRVLGVNIDITQRKVAELTLRERDAMLRESTAEIRTLNIDLERRVEQRTRALAAVNRELESFSYSVSHDLRAPLRSIDGFSQILLQEYSDTLDDTARGYLTRLRAGSQRMAKLIDDLLVLASVTRRNLQVRTCDLTALAREIAQELQRAEPGRQARINVADGMVVTADPGLLRIVLDNLLRNAWKFTSTKAEAIIEVGYSSADGESTYFVQDNGVGFDMTYVNKLFGAFQRLHSDAEFQGTGIGLALVQRVIRRHGGQVRGEGVPGRGATFYFMLPEQSLATSEPVAQIAASPRA